MTSSFNPGRTSSSEVWRVHLLWDVHLRLRWRYLGYQRWGDSNRWDSLFFLFSVVLVGFLQRKKKNKILWETVKGSGADPSHFLWGRGGIKVDDDDSCVVVFDIFVGLGTTPNLLGNHPIFETILYIWFIWNSSAHGKLLVWGPVVWPSEWHCCLWVPWSNPNGQRARGPHRLLGFQNLRGHGELSAATPKAGDVRDQQLQQDESTIRATDPALAPIGSKKKSYDFHRGWESQPNSVGVYIYIYIHYIRLPVIGAGMSKKSTNFSGVSSTLMGTSESPDLLLIREKILRKGPDVSIKPRKEWDISLPPNLNWWLF